MFPSHTFHLDLARISLIPSLTFFQKLDTSLFSGLLSMCPFFKYLALKKFAHRDFWVRIFHPNFINRDFCTSATSRIPIPPSSFGAQSFLHDLHFLLLLPPCSPQKKFAKRLYTFRISSFGMCIAESK
ncbi:hypothetical protein I3760_01G001000 [Carya illinoinensis]|nr:hypothetical protein I3760_01G001000 [Carya illinoinensis]